MESTNVTPIRNDVEQRDVHAEIKALQARTRLSQSKIARESGVNTTALNQWLKGAYPGDNHAVEAKLARWIDAYQMRELEDQALPAAPAWIDTPTSKRVLAALTYAQLAGDVAVTYGAAGLGKTTAARRHAEVSPNVWIATMSPATASVVPALEQIAESVGLREATGGGARIQRAIIHRIRGTHGLLVIDEAQHLNVAALDAIRALHDATDIGLALMGNEMLYGRMTGGNRAPYLDRLYSRIGKRVRLTRATEEDVAALLSAWKIRDRAVRKVLTEIAKRPGGLRGVTKVLRLAALYSANSSGGIGETDIRAAWSELGGDGGAS
jgi:hypothetical protein